MTERRFPPPWTVETIPGGLKVCDANGQSLAYVYSRKNPNDAHMAKVPTEDEARRRASNIARLPTLLGDTQRDQTQRDYKPTQLTRIHCLSTNNADSTRDMIGRS